MNASATPRTPVTSRPGRIQPRARLRLLARRVTPRASAPLTGPGSGATRSPRAFGSGRLSWRLAAEECALIGEEVADPALDLLPLRLVAGEQRREGRGELLRRVREAGRQQLLDGREGARVGAADDRVAFQTLEEVEPARPGHEPRRSSSGARAGGPRRA